MNNLVVDLLVILTRLEGRIDLVDGGGNEGSLVLAVERLWIYAGNLAEEHRRAAGEMPGVDPWAELYGYRNMLAHALPGEVAEERVWRETRADLPRLVEEVRRVGQ